MNERRSIDGFEYLITHPSLPGFKENKGLLARFAKRARMLGVWAVNAVIFVCELRLWSYSIVLEQGGWSEEELNGTHFGSCCVKPQEGCKTRQASLARVMREREALLSFSSMVASILFLCLAMLLKQKEWYLYHYK